MDRLGWTGSKTILFVGGHYEVKGSEITKYYFAGAQRVAMRKYTIPQNMTVEYILGDHLGSTSLTTDSTGTKTSEMRYNPWGEVRYTWTTSLSTTPAYQLTRYTYTGQYSDMDDPTTAGVTEGFGLMFYQARWYDPGLGRFAQADSIVPPGVQGLDRYAAMFNNPIKYNDPSGHTALCGAACEEEFERKQYSLDDMAAIYGINFNEGWSVTNKAIALVAVDKIAHAFQKQINADTTAAYQSCLEDLATPTSTCSQPTHLTPYEAFKKVYRKGLNFLWGCPDCSRMALAKSSNTVAFRIFYTWGDIVLKNTNLVIHELGHVFDQLKSYKIGSRWYGPSSSLTTDLASHRTGFGDLFIDQQSDVISNKEIFADMFVHWLQGGWKIDEFKDEVNSRIAWLNQFMPRYIP